MSKPVISTKTTKMLYRNKLNARQLAVFFCAITMYLFYYFCKSNLSVATEPIQQTFGFQVRSLALFSPQLPLYMLQGNLSMGS